MNSNKKIFTKRKTCKKSPPIMGGDKKNYSIFQSILYIPNYFHYWHSQIKDTYKQFLEEKLEYEKRKKIVSIMSFRNKDLHSDYLQTKLSLSERGRSLHLFNQNLEHRDENFKLDLYANDEDTKIISEDAIENLKFFVDTMKTQGVKNEADRIYKSNGTLTKLLYFQIIKKYGSKCIIRLANAYPGFKYPEKVPSSALYNSVQKCLKDNVKIFIIPLTYEIHFNMLIYRVTEGKGGKVLHQIDHFEPHGFTMKSTDEANIVSRKLGLFILNILKEIQASYEKEGITIRIQYNPPDEICPVLHGIQTIHSRSIFHVIGWEGHCVVWSMIFAELILLNPQTPSKLVYRQLLNLLDKNPAELDKLLIGYLSKANENFLVILHNLKVIPDDTKNVFNYVYKLMTGYHQEKKDNEDKDKINLKKLINLDNIVEIYLNKQYKIIDDETDLERRSLTKETKTITKNIATKTKRKRNESSPVKIILDNSSYLKRILDSSIKERSKKKTKL